MREWDKIKLGYACQITKGIQLNKMDLEKSGDYPCINGGISHSGYTDKWNQEENTITISEGGNSCGYINYLKTKFWSGGHCYSLLNIRDTIDKIFLYYALKSKESLIMNLRVGSGLPNIQQKAIKEFEILYPTDKLEQIRIAEILSTTDEDIANTEALIAKYQRIKTGLMQDLLTRGIDERGNIRSKATHKFVFKNGIEVPEEWDVVRLETLGTIKGRVGWKGYTVSDLRDTGPLTLGAGNINKENKLDLSEKIHLVEEKYIESPEIMVKKGDILIVQRGSIGKLCLIDEEIGNATINPSMVLLKEIRINAHFLYCYLCSNIVQKQIKDATSQTGVPMISQKQCKDFFIANPQPDEQKRISECLIAAEIQINQEISYLQKLQSIKTGLMQDLLSGRVRVPEEMMI
jgi:type I restriction enzyme, S subunit